MRLVGEALRRHKDALGSLVTLEVGKIKAEGDGEVQEMIDIADFAVGLSRMLCGQHDALGAAAAPPVRAVAPARRGRHHQRVQFSRRRVVVECVPRRRLRQRLRLEAVAQDAAGQRRRAAPVQRRPRGPRVPAGVLPLQYGRCALATRFVDDPRVDLVSFTGSSAVGGGVADRVARRFGSCLLELGGNNAIIVDEHANLDLAVPAILFGAVGTAGQRCTSTRRLLVHQSRLDELTTRLVAAYRQVPIGDPLLPTTLMGPLIDPAAVERYQQVLKELEAQGARVLCGGKVRKGPGNFVEPTIVLAENEWPVVQHETFAPILYVIPCRDLDEAIAKQNAVPQGLSSAIFTDRLQNAERFLSHTGSDCGIANVNIGTSGAEIGGAFGGEKETGGGREAGSDSWKAYMRRQTVTINYGSTLPLAQGIDFSVGKTSAS